MAKYNSFEELFFNALKNGASAKSVYDLWIELGNTGTPQDFIDSLKGLSADVKQNVSVATSAWSASGDIYKATITDASIKSTDVVNVNFVNTSLQDAIDAGILGYTTSVDGSFDIYSNYLPTKALVLNYAVIHYV